MLQNLLFRSSGGEKEEDASVGSGGSSEGVQGEWSGSLKSKGDVEEAVVKMEDVEDKQTNKLRGAQKRKPTVVRRYVREVKGVPRKPNGLVMLNGFAGGEVSGGGAMTLTAQDVFKASELELPGCVGMNGHLGWRVGGVPNYRHVVGDEGINLISTTAELMSSGAFLGHQVIRMGLSPRELYGGEQTEAYDLSCKNARPESSTTSFSEDSFVAPEVVLEVGSGGVNLWEDPRQREALGDFVYAAAVASRGDWNKTGGVAGEEDDRMDNDYDRSYEGPQGLAFQEGGGREYCASIPPEAEMYMYSHRSVVTSSGDVLETTGFDRELHEDGGEPSSTSWAFVEPTQLAYKSQRYGQIPQLLSSMHSELPQQVPQKRPRGRPRHTPTMKLGGASSSEVSTTILPSPRRGRPKGSKGQKLTDPFCSAKTCLENEERTKRLREERRAAAKAMRQEEKFKRIGCGTETTRDQSSGHPEESPKKLEDPEEGRFGDKKPKQVRYRTERPFSCPHCPGSFTLRSNMERHGKQQHPALWMPSPSTRHQRRKAEPQKTDYGLYWDETTTQY